MKVKTKEEAIKAFEESYEYNDKDIVTAAVRVNKEALKIYWDKR